MHLLGGIHPTVTPFTVSQTAQSPDAAYTSCFLVLPHTNTKLHLPAGPDTALTLLSPPTLPRPPRRLLRGMKKAETITRLQLPASFVDQPQSQVWALGSGAQGALGLGPTASVEAPTPIPELTGKNVTEVSAYGNHSAAATIDGTRPRPSHRTRPFSLSPPSPSPTLGPLIQYPPLLPHLPRISHSLNVPPCFTQYPPRLADTSLRASAPATLPESCWQGALAAAGGARRALLHALPWACVMAASTTTLFAYPEM